MALLVVCARGYQHRVRVLSLLIGFCYVAIRFALWSFELLSTDVGDNIKLGGDSCCGMVVCGLLGFYLLQHTPTHTQS